MNRARFALEAALLGAGALVLVAAQAQQPPSGAPPHAGMPMSGMGMMGGGMGMMGGMQNPMGHSLMTTFLLPEMQTELGLSTQQTGELRQFKQEMLAKGKDVSAQVAAKQKELEALLASDTSKGAHVKTLLEQMGNLRAQRQFAAYETARKMKGVLTDDQKAKLVAMKPAELRQVMMSHMTMADMMEMMQFMGGAGMMSGGMGMMGMMAGG
jgi:LTXXQ motif family protein